MAQQTTSRGVNWLNTRPGDGGGVSEAAACYLRMAGQGSEVKHEQEGPSGPGTEERQGPGASCQACSVAKVSSPLQKIHFMIMETEGQGKTWLPRHPAELTF